MPGYPPSDPVLQTRGPATALLPTAQPALEVLPGFAERYLREVDAGVVPEPLFGRLPGAGPVVAVPIRTAGRLIGMLVLARGQGADAFDALALPLLRGLAEHAGTAIANVRLHEEVRRLSVTDPLTGVGNVRHLTTTLSREVAVATRFDRPLTVLMLDLDHFKQVNDTLGHQFGDVVLREFAHRVMTCVREMDTVARYGGEEFAVVLPDTDVAGGCRVAERVIKVVRAEPFQHGDLWQAVTVSIGVASFPGHGRSATEVLHAADEALYAAKHEGRDRWEVARTSPSAAAVSQAG
jgi:diguanylate cyclase (GGDEF)-like protein